MPVIFACLLLALAPDHYARQPAFDVERYLIELNVDLEQQQLGCSSRIEILLTDKAAPFLRLDYAGPALDRVLVDQQPVRCQSEGEQLVIPLSEAMRADGRVLVESSYRGRPAKGFYFKQNRHGDKVAFTDNWPEMARGWLPCIDHPSDRARAEFRIRAPSGLCVIANGVAQAPIAAAMQASVHVFRQDLPIATYLLAVAVAPLDVIDDAQAPNQVPRWQAFVYPQERAEAVAFARSGDVLRTLEEIAGPYPFPKLALVQIPTRFGGMENAGCIFLNERCLERPEGLTPLVAHEVAHQWFGDLIGIADWSELWLSEGFATYGAVLVQERLDGKEALAKKMRRLLAELLASDTVTTQCIRDRASKDPESALNALNYSKGAFVLHMLRRTLGDEAFFRLLRQHVIENAQKVITTEDFRAVAERIAGRSLARFFTQWIDQPGYPELQVTRRFDAARRMLNLTVTQKQSELFAVDLDVTLDDQVVTVPITERTTVFEVARAKAPERVGYNEQAWLLARIEEGQQ